MNIIKISLLGSEKTGKSSFTTLLNTGKIEEINDYDVFYYQIENDVINMFSIVDKNEANIIFLMFDLSNLSTLDYVDKICKNTQTPIILLGNKNDLVKFCPKTEYHNNPVYSIIIDYKNKYSNIIEYYDISVKTFSHITQVLDSVLQYLEKNKN
jgi:tRNA U34 5-carboxymethylaminomethyl modifying GTPase MnmE/TrmE